MNFLPADGVMSLVLGLEEFCAQYTYRLRVELSFYFTRCSTPLSRSGSARWGECHIGMFYLLRLLEHVLWRRPPGSLSSKYSRRYMT